MSAEHNENQQSLPDGVMLNAYPDSIGGKLSDIVGVLKRPELRDAFSLFYILPTFFNSDLDRGFSIIDYNLNDELVCKQDLKELSNLDITFKFDLILNHLSVASPQFKDLLKHGDKSEYKHFFVDWNEFWHAHGQMGEEGYVIPKEDFLNKLFMRKPGLPILKVGFPDGSQRPYWNTFYQQVDYKPVSATDFTGIQGVTHEAAKSIAAIVNENIGVETDANQFNLDGYAHYKNEILSVVERNRSYLGQMDLNAKSKKVWHFYEETLKKLKDYGAKIIRLDAFAYLHKEPGESNFFNRPGTWDYLERLKQLANRYGLTIFPEIHSEYGAGLHEEVAEKGYPIYDFFFPGLVIDALENVNNRHLLKWIGDIQDKGLQTINMLGCHDGIPLLDLKGNENNGVRRDGLLDDDKIQALIDRIIERGGRVKNLYGPDGKKIAYYQVNATFFSALGEDEDKLRLARAIQLFMPGIPQVWYLDLFAGKNDHLAADNGGAADHKEINRTNLSLEAVESGLRKQIVKDQIELIRLRNCSEAFKGNLEIYPTDSHLLHLNWKHAGVSTTLKADLRSCRFTIEHSNSDGSISHLNF
ncbi:MAG: glycosidase [Candidatus Thiodiazotropha sp.]